MFTRSRFLKYCQRAALVTAAACALATTNASAASDDEIVVRYGDLNMATTAGVQRLYKRIHSAAEILCGTRDGYRTVDSRAQSKECVEEAVAAAVKQVNNGMLTAMHSNKQQKRRLG